MKKKIAAFIFTEYHLLLFINEYIINNKQSVYRLYLPKLEIRRFKNEFDFKAFNIELIELEYELKLVHTYDEYYQIIIKDLVVFAPDTIMLFQENNLISPILINTFGGKNTEIVLFQDGMKPYVKFSRFSKSIFLSKLEIFKWLLKNKLNPWVFSSYLKLSSYGNLKHINKLGLTNPEYYDNWNRLDLQKIEFPKLPLLKETLNKVFQMDDIKGFDNAIIYFNQPFRFSVSDEFDILKRIMIQNKLEKVFFKLHPQTNPEYIKTLKNFDWIETIEIKVPAEMILINAKNSLILSPYSTALLFHVPNNKYYYLYNFILKGNSLLKKLNFNNLPSDHIKIANQINEIIL